MDITGVISRSAANTMDAPSSVPNAQNQLEFADILGKRTADSFGTNDPKKVRETVEAFVATAFVQPIFKELRASNHAEGPFAPSKAEKQFQSLIDAQLARRMVHKSNWPLVDRMAQNMLAKIHSAPQNELEKTQKNEQKKELEEQLHGPKNQHQHLGRLGVAAPGVHSQARTSFAMHD